MVVPFGKVNVLHDSDFRDTTNKPIYNTYIVPGTWTDVGTGIYGANELTGDWELNYELFVINGLAHGAPISGGGTTYIDGSKGIREARNGFKADNNKNKAIVGRVGISPSLDLEVGGSFYTGDYDNSGEKNLSIVGADVTWKNGPFEAAAEYAQIKLDATATLPTEMSGYFVEGRYHFFPDFLKDTFLAKNYAHPTFTAIGRISAVDLDSSVTDAKDMTQITLGINYRPIETVAYKLEYEINQEGASEVANNAIIASVAVGF